MDVCVYVNNVKFDVGSRITVRELIEMGGGNVNEYELQKRDGRPGKVVEVYRDPSLTIDLAASLPSPGRASGGQGTDVTEAGSGAPGGNQGTDVTEAGSTPTTSIEADCTYFTTRFTGVIHAA